MAAKKKRTKKRRTKKVGGLPKKAPTEKTLQKDLKTWFLVSMWHDIAYMVEKGNKVLEQHITSFLQPNERNKGLLPWHPSLGNQNVRK